MPAGRKLPASFYLEKILYIRYCDQAHHSSLENRACREPGFLTIPVRALSRLEQGRIRKKKFPGRFELQKLRTFYRLEKTLKWNWDRRIGCFSSFRFRGLLLSKQLRFNQIGD